MKSSIPTTKTALLLAGLLTLPAAHAEQLPLWEAGLGVATISLPNYRGADESGTYVLPAPYFVYRGDFFKADRDGIRSVFFESERVEVNISLNATLPVDSKDNPARRGMSDLKPTIELGPTASFTLWRTPGDKVKLDLRTPVRAAITIESSPKTIGWVFSPNLNLDIKDPAGLAGWNLGMLAGPLFQSRKYNDYFYSVGAADATAARPAYSAPGGYAGSQFTMAMSKRFPRYWVGGFLRYDTLGGAAFEDSSLVRKRSAVSAGVAVAWVFGESSTRVEAD
ncbi:MipA/OmpV family protein [Noviherbaspirillum cavernae]|uniref:MipA/OmpV family protein n=1 Tax=Noviherbaspirillum cavernae TaxID=2320862 RepID=A0A418X5G0_9BURK|nr:MipA/OmpV family protein [Noviherbaspirillum cavernae]RJG07659.1 MipA/OmpV family protein [Noviherbaspirillum cavernae]